MNKVLVFVLFYLFWCISSQFGNEVSVKIQINTEINVPTNIKYNQKPIDFKQKAASKIKKMLTDQNIKIDDVDSFFTCGPFLWRRVSKIDDIKKAKGPEMNISNMNLTGKIIMDDQPSIINLFNYIKKDMIKENIILLRNLDEEELSIFWATIMFDIEDPIFILESGKQKIFIQLGDNLKLKYLDDFYGMSLRKNNSENVSEEVDKFLKLCDSGNHNDVRKMLASNKGLVNCIDEKGNSALMHSVLSKNRDLIQFLIEQGADVNHRSNEKDSALLYAVTTGDVEIVKMLVLNGSKVNVKNTRHLFPFFISVMRNYTQIRDFLLENGADPNMKDEK